MAKTTKEMIEVMQAYEDGYTIQVYDEDCEVWIDWKSKEPFTPRWNWYDDKYRIKPESKTRAMTFDEIFEWWKSHRTEIIICKDDRYDIDSKGFIVSFDFIRFLICLEDNHYDEKEFYKYCTKEDGSKFEIVEDK